MSISERPWCLIGGLIAVQAPSTVRGVTLVQSQEDLEHAVACTNALHAAKVTPEALVRDPGCVAKLVEAAREHLESVARCALDDGTPTRSICQGDADDLESALRACGIEVPA